MTYFLNQAEITHDEEKNEYFDKDGNLLDTQDLLTIYDDCVA